MEAVAKERIRVSLEARRAAKVDPFLQGFDCDSNAAQNAFDLGVVRLCFQVFVKKRPNDASFVPLVPVLSNVLRDKSGETKLRLFEPKDTKMPISGGKRMEFECGEIEDGDKTLQMVFERRDGRGRKIWQTALTRSRLEIKKNRFLSFLSPALESDSEVIERDVPVRAFLFRKSDRAASKSVGLTFVVMPKNDEDASLMPKVTSAFSLRDEECEEETDDAQLVLTSLRKSLAALNKALEEEK